MSDSYSLTIPVFLPAHPDCEVKPGNVEVIEESFSRSTPSSIVAWGHQLPSVSAAKVSGAHGVAVGCDDGSVYILHSACAAPPPDTLVSISAAGSNSEPVSPPTSPRRFRSLQHPPSRSASPSSAKATLSPFQVTRSRVVSAVSAESAEAPKNYVDFDEEQEKLKGMLNGRGSRKRHPSTSLTRPEESTSSSPVAGNSLRREDMRSHLSATLSPSSSTLSLSSPPSPTLIPTASPESHGPSSLTLRCHVFTPCAGLDPVSALKVHADGRYISCLRTSGALSVHMTSDGTCIASTFIEANPHPIPGGKIQSMPPMLWTWRRLFVATSEESSIVMFACASPDEFYPMNQFLDAGTGDVENLSLVAAYELCIGPESAACETQLSSLGQWPVRGPLNSIGLRAKRDHSLNLFHADHTGRLVSRSIRLRDPPPTSPADLPESHSSNHLPLPNPFKALKALSTENIPETSTESLAQRIEVGAQVDYGELGLTEPVRGLRAHESDAIVFLCGWSDHELLVYRWKEDSLERLPILAVSEVQDVRWIDHEALSVLCADCVQVYDVPDPTASEKTGGPQPPRMLQTIQLESYDIAALTPGGHIVSTRVKKGRRRIHHTSVDASATSPAKTKTRAVWKARMDAFASPITPRISCMLPLDVDLILLGHTDGHLERRSLGKLVRNGHGPIQSSDSSLPGAILALDIIQNSRTGERVVAGGADDGSIAFWSLETFRLCARWTIFTTPLARIISLHDEKIGRLHGCVLCVSQDGTIAVIALDGYQFVYLVPASAAPLKRICLGEDNLLLMYADGRARLWDTRTREFWRSMSLEKADELVQQGGWFEWLTSRVSDNNRALSSAGFATPDAASTLLLDIPALLRQLSGSPALVNAVDPQVQDPEKKLQNIRILLSLLLTFGISEGIDVICSDGLGVKPAPATLGVVSPDTVSVVVQPNTQSVWTLSPEASADRALAILSMLHFLAQFEDLARDASTVITFYAASIGQLVGDYQPPSLPRLAHHFLHTQTGEIRHAVRLLLDAGVARLSDVQTTELAEAWQDLLPSKKPEKERDTSQCAQALCICGFIAVDKYSLLPTSTLTDIARSIAMYLHDETCPHRSLAIDLCSRGFQIWQQYVDAVEMLRALFTLATTTKKEAISVPNIGVQARSAVLQIAASNTPLFMTTLVLDILHPRTVQHRKSVMQLVIFLIRKKPLVLYSNLPRLVEAIVKSLDPNSSASRDAVLDSATEILSHIVQTFPTVDFHMSSQRLAVGTSEGAVVMYDLKTATRLYVLEGHKRRTTACSFSPDGRRLVTLSLEESDVLVWKVGSSFTSFFMPGAPPRQGHNGSEPYKTLNFNIGEAAHMSVEATLVNVRFEWTADRSVRLIIKDTILTFST